jgi:flagellar motor switch protein FliN/FliY
VLRSRQLRPILQAISQEYAMADSSNIPSDADIQAALKAAQEAVAAVNLGTASAPPTPPPVTPPPGAAGNEVDLSNPLAGLDIAALQAEAAAQDDGGGSSRGANSGTTGGRAIGGEHIPSPFDPPIFVSGGSGEKPAGIDLLGDVHLNVKIELGRTRMLVEDVLRLGDGSVVELDKLAGDPVDIYVNDRPVARGEVLVLNDNFCVRINEIVSHTPQARAAG